MGNLDAKRDWGFAGDYVRAMWLMLQQDHADDYVIATGKTYSVRDFLNTVFDIAEIDVQEHVRIHSRLFRPHEVPLLLGSPTKANQQLGWKCEVDFKELATMMYNNDYEMIRSSMKG